MKKSIVFLAASFFVISLFAQSEKYLSAMQPKVIAIDTTHSIDNLKDLAAAFERIGDAEKTQWLPYYYAALANVNAGNMVMVSNGGAMGGFADKTDPLADKAEELLNKAEALSKDNAEIYIVRKMIASLRLMGDPMSRYMTYGPAAAEALETAKKLSPDNPRIFLLEGIDKYYTPEQYGGSKQEAKELFELAQKKFDSFKPESDIHPNWGRGQVNYFLSLSK